MQLRLSFLAPGLTEAESRTLKANFTSADALPEKFTQVALGCPGPLSRYSTDFLFAYDVFPAGIIRGEPEWTRAGRGMRIGDVVVQRAYLPPLGFGLCAEFAVRITAIFDEPGRLGFAYETLDGHAERGTSEFYFEERAGEVFFVIHTRSEPGHWLARLGGRVFTLPYQRWCTRQALRHVQERFHHANPGARQVQD